MNFAKVSVKRPVATLMAILVAISFGFLSLSNLSMDLFPNMNIPIALVMTTYDGAGPEEIETLITEPLEKTLASLGGLDELTSTSSSGVSMIMIQFTNDVDIDNAAADVREKVDLVKSSLPDDAQDPMVIKLDINSTSSIMISATAEGKDITELKELIEDEVSPRFERQNGVASVSLYGGEEREIRVIVDQNKLRGYGISEATVSSMLAAENINVPLGTISQGDKNLTLRVKGEFQSLEEIENTALTTSTGGTIYVRDIAEVREEFTDTASMSYTDGVPSIMMSISKQSTANTVNVSSAVMAEMAKVQSDMPEVNFKVISDPADYIKDSLSSVADSALKGGILAIIVLYVFLRNFRSTLVVGVAMPVSIVTTFAFMYFFGVNFNLMSLGGLTLGIGMLVDNSIVVLESIYKKLEDGEDRFTAAIEGGREVTNSVIASTLTTVVVFLPITFVGGTVGELFNDLCLTIVFSLMSSLIVALTFVPMASSILLSPERVSGTYRKKNLFNKVLDIIGIWLDNLDKGYRVILRRALRNKKITALIAVAFVIATGISLTGVGVEFMPSSDEGQVSISVKLPKGTKIESTEKIAWQVIDAIQETPEIDDISMTMGGSGAMSALTGSSEDNASITVNLVEKDQRDKTSNEVAIGMRALVKDIAGAEIEVTASSSSMGSYSGGGAEIIIKGDEMETLQQIGNDFVDILKSIPGTADVKTSVEDAAPQTTIRLDRGKATNYGISVGSVASLLRTDISGTAATTYKISGDEYDIRVMQDTEKINFITDVENLLIPTSKGTSVPLYEIADITTEDVPVSISRDNQTRYITVTANLEGVVLGDVNKQFAEKVKIYDVPEGYTWENGGTSEQMATAFSGLALALLIAVFLVYMVMAAEFEAFSFPLIVMCSVPIAMTGGLFGCFVFGQPISVTSFLGLIMLAGVVINNAIVLIDYGNLLVRERGYTPLDAMEEAGPVRLRPILMSTLTTVLAMVPMMVSQAEGSEMMRGLAVVVVFGLTLSTLVTLLLVPAVYVGFNNRMEKHLRRKERRHNRKELKKELKLEKKNERNSEQ